MKNYRILLTLAWAIVIGALLTLFLTLVPLGPNSSGKKTEGVETSKIVLP